MKKILLICFLFAGLQITSNAQLHVGVFGGMSAYLGELTQKIFPKKVINGAIGFTANYEVNDNIMIRAGYTFTRVGGADRFSDDESLRTNRNLSFETAINEFSLMGEYYLLNLYDYKFTPYGFVGLAYFSFDPYAYNGTTDKIYLRELRTEGQGVSGYPKEYNIGQLSIPFGGGVKYAFTPRLRLGLEAGLRKTFTDYLDDVSGTYADANDLLLANGQMSVDMAYRGDEAGGNASYPEKGVQRGNPDNKDFYYFIGLHLTYGLDDMFGGGGGSGLKGKGKGGTACPVNVY